MDILFHFTEFDYVSKPNTVCRTSSKINEYNQLEVAQRECMNDGNCWSITNINCVGNKFVTCKDSNLKVSAYGSCSWLKVVAPGNSVILDYL